MSKKPHEITERRAPNAYLALCSCGWSHRVPMQNAYARAAKMRAAISKHLTAANANHQEYGQ